MTTSDIQKQLAKLRRDKKLLWLGIMFFVMVVLWILSSIFTVTKTSSISPELRDLAKSFVPRLESKVFDEILTKRTFSEDELVSFPIYIFDRNNLNDDDSTLMDIINSEKDSVGTDEVAPISVENSSQLEEPEPPVSQATDSAAQDNGFVPIPIENIIGPQN